MDKLGLRDFIDVDILKEWENKEEIEGETILDELMNISHSKKKKLIEKMLSIIIFQDNKLKQILCILIPPKNEEEIPSN